MIDEVGRLLDQYSAWLRERTSLRQVKDWVEITTPYLDRHNDYLQIYAKRRDGGFLLTDDSYVLEDLERSGCKLDSPNRKKLLEVTLCGLGVALNGTALEVHATPESFPLRKHSLVQAMLAVNDLFCLATPMVTRLFYEDVVAWLDLGEIRYTPKVKFSGRSGYDHLFDFVIPRSRVQPERILRAINRPSRDTAQAMAFSWIDTKDVRAPESRAYAVLNDSDRTVPPDVLDALRSYEVHPILWTQRDHVRAELEA
ncbi:MAG: DUF1829 domain-containing protein [Candidatus Latescibacterota bacterium]